jgi:hypothetical protein
MIAPSNLVTSKPKETAVFKQEASRCGYDHQAQVRNWRESEKVRIILMSTGAPTSSTAFDGERDE